MSDAELKKDGDKVVVMVGEELTVSQVPALKPLIQTALADGALEVEFDFAKTVAIDSSGIGFLIATFNSVRKKDGVVRILEASEDIFRLLQSMRLEKRLCVTKR